MPRGRKPAVEPTTEVHLRLRASLLARLRILFFSEAEQRVPYGALNRFFEEQIVQSLDHRPLDLAPYCGVPPGTYVIRAEPEVVDKLRGLLEKVR
jgi:hypothetical protein